MCGRVMQHVTCACHHIVCTCDARIRLYGVGCYPFVGVAGIRLPLTRTQLTSSRTRKSLCTTAVTAKWSVFCTAIYSTTHNSNEDIMYVRSDNSDVTLNVICTLNLRLAYDAVTGLIVTPAIRLM